jgi:uncharacterized membrane protein
MLEIVTLKYDIIAFLLSIFLILIYYLYLSRRTKRYPNLSAHALNEKVRYQWVEMIMNSGGKMDILAIQTLRNSVMAANFMASTAILLIIGTLNISDKIGEFALDWQYNLLAVNYSSELWQIKLSLLLLDFFITFFFFSMSIRFFNHVGYMINLKAYASPDENIYNQSCAYLNKAGAYYRLGTRAIFFSLPIILWIFGPYSLILSTIILIGGLAMLDKAPNVEFSSELKN